MTTTPEAQRESLLHKMAEAMLSMLPNAHRWKDWPGTMRLATVALEVVEVAAQPPAPPVPAQPVWSPETHLDSLQDCVHTSATPRVAKSTRSVPEVPVALPDIDELAQHIRWLNGSNKTGAGILAEKIIEWLKSRAGNQALPSAMDACDSAESERQAFEADAERYGFDLSPRVHPLCPEPWEEYIDADTGHRWGGWLARADQLGQQGREQAAKTAGSDDKRAALTESILALGTVEQTAPVIGLLVAYIESLAGDE